MKKRPVKIALQLVLCLLLIASVVYFVRNRQAEVQDIADQLVHARPEWLLIGLALTAAFILVQALMYRHCFRAMGAELPLGAFRRLYLKRHLAALFLPAGGVTSLALFTAEAERAGIPPSKIHFASTLRLLLGTVTVALVAVPVLIWVTLRQGLDDVWGGLLWMTGTVAALAWTLCSLRAGGKAMRWACRLFPRLRATLEELRTHPFRLPEALRAMGWSFLLEVLGVAHLWVSMRALGLTPELETALLGYVAVVLAIMASPFLKGVGAAEAALTWALTQEGLSLSDALATALLFRLFEFWLPLLAGVATFLVAGWQRFLAGKRRPAVLSATRGAINGPQPALRTETSREFLPESPNLLQRWPASLLGISERLRPPDT